MKRISIKKLLAALLALALLFAAAGCNLDLDEEEETTLPDKSAVGNDIADVVDYYNALIANVFEGRPSVQAGRWVNTDSIEFVKGGESGPSLDAMNAFAKQIKTRFNMDIDNNAVPYGEDPGGVFRNVPLDAAADVLSAAFNTKEREGEIIVEDSWFTIALNDYNYPAPEDSVIARLFEALDPGEFMDEFSKTGSYLEIGAFEDMLITYTGSKIVVGVDRKTDELWSVTFIKVIEIVAPVKGVGSLAEYGELEARVTLSDSTRFDFNWTDPNAEY